MAYTINNLLCISCETCLQTCKNNAVRVVDFDFIQINEENCIECGSCIQVCKKNAISNRKNELDSTLK